MPKGKMSKEKYRQCEIWRVMSLVDNAFYPCDLSLFFLHSFGLKIVQIHHPNILAFIELLQKEEVRFHHMNTQFNAGLAARAKQVTTIPIQNRVDTVDRRYYDGLIDVMEYLDGFSQVVATKKK
jgi:hypothetical protein